MGDRPVPKDPNPEINKTMPEKRVENSSTLISYWKIWELINAFDAIFHFLIQFTKPIEILITSIPVAATIGFE